MKMSKMLEEAENALADEKLSKEALDKLQSAVTFLFEAQAAKASTNKDASERIQQSWHALKTNIEEPLNSNANKADYVGKLARIEMSHQEFEESKSWAKMVKGEASDQLKSAQEQLKLALTESRQLRLPGM